MAADRTIHIVDDDARFRTALQRLLQAAGFGTIQYGTPQAFLDAVGRLAGRCALFDVRMPGIDGLQILERMQALGSRMPVILMTGYGDVPTAVRALKAGASDFIEKPFDDEHLILAIEAAHAANERDVKVAEAAKSIATLSRRERQVLDGLVVGQPNKTIAFELGISVRTVEVHRTRMLERLRTRRLADAIRVAVLASLAFGPF